MITYFFAKFDQRNLVNLGHLMPPIVYRSTTSSTHQHHQLNYIYTLPLKNNFPGLIHLINPCTPAIPAPFLTSPPSLTPFTSNS